MTAPSKLAHFVLQTNQMTVLRDWYCTVLDAYVQMADENLTFLAYDDEHHRLAIAQAPRELKPKDPKGVGVHHIAFTFADLATLCNKYEVLKAIGLMPWWTIKHGPSLSMYYRDPDGNNVELQVDSYDTLDECNEFMRGPLFAANPVGEEFDPEQLIADLRNHVPMPTLLQRQR
jgi:catechol-2,3-dioxygenase